MKNLPKDRISSEIARLQKPIAGRRVGSWFLFLLFLLAFLVIPVVASLRTPSSDVGATSQPGIHPPAGGAPATSAQNLVVPRVSPRWSVFGGADTYWNPGRLSTVHQPWAGDCKACHSTPFVRVQDNDCLVCHKNMHEHVSRATVTLDELHETRCASCHREHKGLFGLAEQNKGFVGHECASCHQTIRTLYPATRTGNVSDFADAHPAFRLQLATGAGPTALERIRQDGDVMLSEKNSLKFPHDVHLSAKGIRSPDGKVTLKCDSCHKPDSNGKNFLPVTMKDNCQYCHALKFDLAAPDRQVPHGPVDQVLSTLREFYSYVRVNGVAVTRQEMKNPIVMTRPGEAEPAKTFIHDNNDVRSHAIASATELFEKTSCVVCHDVSRVAGPGLSATPAQDMPQWKIAPVPAAHAWMPKAEFDHSRHRASRCTECHAAVSSHKATDVLMPTIKQCRACHAGEKPVVNKVTSDCGLCHGFHQPEFSAASALVQLHELKPVRDQ